MILSPIAIQVSFVTQIEVILELDFTVKKIRNFVHVISSARHSLEITRHRHSSLNPDIREIDSEAHMQRERACQDASKNGNPVLFHQAVPIA
jgi:hypothetical protein